MCTNLELLRFYMAAYLVLKLLHIQTFFTPYCRCQVDILELVTGRCLDHGRHEEDIKVHFALF
jgi:hypothetical protein